MADKTTPEDHEIEVTPEMIQAGVSALRRWNPNFDSHEWCAREVFLAMATQYPDPIRSADRQ